MGICHSSLRPWSAHMISRLVWNPRETLVKHDGKLTVTHMFFAFKACSKHLVMSEQTRRYLLFLYRYEVMPLRRVQWHDNNVNVMFSQRPPGVWNLVFIPWSQYGVTGPGRLHYLPDEHKKKRVRQGGSKGRLTWPTARKGLLQLGSSVPSVLSSCCVVSQSCSSWMPLPQCIRGWSQVPGQLLSVEVELPWMIYQSQSLLDFSLNSWNTFWCFHSEIHLSQRYRHIHAAWYLVLKDSFDHKRFRSWVSVMLEDWLTVWYIP